MMQVILDYAVAMQKQSGRKAMKKSPKRNSFRISAVSTMLVLMGIAIFAAAGCSKPYPSDPMDVVLNFTMDIANQNFDGAKRYCTQNFLDKEFNAAQSMMKTMANMAELPEISKEDKKEAEEFMREMFASMFQSSQEGDTVKVWVKGQEFSKTVLIREKGKWKIDRVESDFSEKDAIEMMKGLGGLGKGLEGLGGALGK